MNMSAYVGMRQHASAFVKRVDDKSEAFQSDELESSPKGLINNKSILGVGDDKLWQALARVVDDIDDAVVDAVPRL